MDSLARVLATSRDLGDLLIVSILAEERIARQAKMVGERTLPVLLDPRESSFQTTYAASAGRPFYLFDREGCLIDRSLVIHPEKPGELDRLQEALRAADW